MKKSIIVLFHIGFWVCYLLIIMIMIEVFYRSSSHSIDQTARVINAVENVLLFAFFPSVITFYLCYFWIFPKFLQRKKFFRALIVGTLVSFGAAFICYMIHRNLIESGFVMDMDDGGKHGRSTQAIVITVMAIIASISGIVALVIRGFITWFEEVRLKEELKLKNQETELALVKAQLDPHFLFNTLNNIDVLILKDPEEASEYLNKLSDILRFMLYETKSDLIFLEKEIKYIEKYIELQKIRSANLSYIHFEVLGKTGVHTIAPMIFIPFIENAFKHTTNKKIGNAITVKIVIEDKQILFTCENKFDSSRQIQHESNGLGNELIQKRLDLIYPGNYKLDVVKRADNYSVHLAITNG